MVSVMTWFVARRPIAMGISSTLGGTGMFIYPLLLAFLREKYGLNGCFLILGGCVLNSCVFGLLLRPAPLPWIPQSAQKSGFDEDPTKRKSANGFDVQIFRNWKFDLLLVSNCLYALGYFPPLMFIASRAATYPSIVVEDADFLPTIVGAANISGRVLAMLLLGRCRINSLLLTAIVELIGGVSIALSVYCESYGLQVAFCILYGIVGGRINSVKFRGRLEMAV